MSKRVVILAGGKGTRLRPYTVALPKPLMPLGDYPILEVIVRQLVTAGFDHITLAVNHQAEIIKAFFQEGQRWGIKIDYSLENEPLGTMGPLRQISDLPKHFLVMNGDVLTDLDFAAFRDYHLGSGGLFTVSSYMRRQVVDYGVLDTDERDCLVGFREKPTLDYEVSMGIYMVSKKSIDYIPQNTFYGFDHLMIDLIKNKEKPKVYKFDGYWLDIGRPDDYSQAVDEFNEMRTKFIL